MLGDYKSHPTGKALCFAPLVTGAVEWVRAGGGGRFAGEGRESMGSALRGRGEFWRPPLDCLLSAVGCGCGESGGQGESLKLGMIERP